MFKMSDYFYKGYDIENKSRLEKLKMEYSNPYGYNFESNKKRKFDSNSITRTNQNLNKKL